MCRSNKILAYVALATVACFGLSQQAFSSDQQALAEAESLARVAVSRAKLDLIRNLEISRERPESMHATSASQNVLPLTVFVQHDDEFEGQEIPKNFFTIPPAPAAVPKPAPAPAPKPAPAAVPKTKATPAAVPKSAPAPAAVPKGNQPSHLSAIGLVEVPHGRNGHYVIGTGTYLGNHLVITASHVVSMLFSGASPKKEGPHYYPVGPNRAFWNFDPKRHKDGRTDGKAKRVPVVGVVAESLYINNTNHGEGLLYDDQVCVDISFLILDPRYTDGLIEMQILNQAPGFKEMCAMVGYAQQKDNKKRGQKHKVAVKLALDKKMSGWGYIQLNRNYNVPQGKQGDAHRQAEDLMDTVLPGGLGMASNLIRSGDSGGPCIAQTKDGRKVIIGINSVSSSPNNPRGISGCASLIEGSAGQWKMGAKVKTMWDYAKAMQLQHHKKP